MESAHGPSPYSFTSPPPWLVHDDNTRPSHDHHQLLICDLAPSSAPSPSPATATAAAPPLNHHHHSLRPAAARRDSNKRRPRPSRKLPTTYIAADPASFRHMVHHVTGAHDDHLLPVPPPPPRPAPSRAAGGLRPGALPTLDTSAFLFPVEAAASSAGFAAAPALDQHAGGVVGQR
ncbi:hypothetical protein HU200_030445 [Digitaria exilis]|uniref:VQ domain-containing protein n=1 Tax=Digitaria exilis TaxID=1010633 RepID=A0A835BRP3_9POAL|nr:hypothetical protein HU200_030445 [Digitaria exilis]CAB3462945.1 unnamed protein product [Digitaria exilis]